MKLLTLSTLSVCVALSILVTWSLNVYRFCVCDFKAPYKGEIIHGAGIITPTFIGTAWVNWDE